MLLSILFSKITTFEKKKLNQEKIKSFSKKTLMWLAISILVGILSGLASSIFLVSLEWVTTTRNNNNWLIFLLPLGGLLIGYIYFKQENSIAKGNNLILEEYHQPTRKIPLLMAPLILIGTLITHLFGGSAGREGTAVQMSTSIADTFSDLFLLDLNERKTLLIIGISAGFASVFGTPFAGTLFALEIVFFSKINFRSVFLSIITAFIAHYTVYIIGVKHTNYLIIKPINISLSTFFWLVLAGVIFGLTAKLFSLSTKAVSNTFKRHIKSPILRPFLGGIVLVILFQFSIFSKFIGLGIPYIENSFIENSNPFDFLLKLLFTAFTLGCGFKGGEVTPLFFVGATLGSALSSVIPLPIAILAAVGFVSVFAGATHAPIASIVMATELFGIEIGIAAAIGCFFSYLFSGKTGIYSSQKVGGLKKWTYEKFGLLSK